LHKKAWIRFTPPPCRMPLGLYAGTIRAYPGVVNPPGFDIAFLFSTRHERFTFVRLPDSYLTGSSPAFSLTLTTMALYQCSLRWFEARSCKPTSRGLPSSFLYFYVAHLHLQSFTSMAGGAFKITASKGDYVRCQWMGFP